MHSADSWLVPMVEHNPSVKRGWLEAGFARFQPAPYLKR